MQLVPRTTSMSCRHSPACRPGISPTTKQRIKCIARRSSYTTPASPICVFRSLARIRTWAVAGQDDVASVVEQMFAGKFGSSVVDRALKDNPAYHSLVQQLRYASPEDLAKFQTYAEGVLSTIKLSDSITTNKDVPGNQSNISENDRQVPLDVSAVEEKLGGIRNTLYELHQSLSGPQAYMKQVVMDYISKSFSESELELMRKLTGVDWSTLQVDTTAFSGVPDNVNNLTIAELAMLAEVTQKLEATMTQPLVWGQTASSRSPNQNQTNEEGKQQQADSSSPDASLSASSKAESALPTIEPEIIPPQPAGLSGYQASAGMLEDDPIMDRTPANGTQGEASTSSSTFAGPLDSFQLLLELLEGPVDLEAERARFLHNAKLADNGTLFLLPMSRHMKVIMQLFTEMAILAEVQQGLHNNFSEQELDFKSEMMARTLADLFAAVQEGKVTDLPSLACLKFLNSQLLQQSEDGALYMWSNGDEAASCISRLSEFILAARSLEVMGKFLEAYTSVVSDDVMALKARKLFEAWADETWWIKDMRDLTEEEVDRWNRYQLVTPDEVAIHLLAELDTDVLVYVTERLTQPADTVLRKWIHHPVIGPKVTDSSLLSTGVPEVWHVLYYIASTDRSGEFDLMSSMTMQKQGPESS